MAVHRSVDDLGGGSRESVRELLADDEEIVIITHHTPRFTPAAIHQYLPYYIVTDRRVVELQRASDGRDKTTDIRLSDFGRVRHTPKRVTGKSEIELSGAGIYETFSMPQAEGEALSEAVRGQLAEQKRPA